MTHIFHPNPQRWTQTQPLICDINRATISLLQNLSGDPVLLPAVEGFGVEHDVGAVARLGAGDVALPAELHPRHSQNRPAQTSSGSAKGTLSSVSFGDDTDRIESAVTPTCHIH